jgi:hypothetical protein
MSESENLGACDFEYSVSKDVMPLNVASTPYFLIPQFQPLQNGGHSNFWGGCKTWTSQSGTIKCCMLIELQSVNNLKAIFVMTKYMNVETVES